MVDQEERERKRGKEADESPDKEIMECEDQLIMVIGQKGSSHRLTGSLGLREHCSHRKE